MVSRSHDETALVNSHEVTELVFGPEAERRVRVEYWDSGQADPAGCLGAEVTVVLTHPGAYRQLLLPPSELGLAEAIIHGDVVVRGKLEAAVQIAPEIKRRLSAPGKLLRLVRLLIGLPASTHSRATQKRPGLRRSLLGKHSTSRDQEAVRSHYDLSNDFYALWLDQQMVYSCAYYQRGDESLDSAQLAKLEHICRKLRLRPGERLLDIGCGWGGLIRYAVRQYGVTALGVTLSPEQARVACERIAADGLSDRCEVAVLDYRHLSESASFDKIASVGMAEHVGGKQLSRYFTKAYKLLRPGGLFLMHSIIAGKRGKSWLRRSLWREGTFTEKYVFPDGELVPLHRLEVAAYESGFETRDVESLREHYAMTLREWTRRMEAAEARALELVGRTNYQIWRLSMAGAAGNFANGRHNIIQMLLAKPDDLGNACGLPLTRSDLYHPLQRSAE